MAIHTIDKVHSPGMVIPAAMARDQRSVAATLTTNSTALRVRKTAFLTP